MLLNILCWFSIFLIVYTYLGYPLLLLFFSRVCKKNVAKQFLKDEALPFVSVVIAVKNEEERIVDRLVNIASQDYPEKKLEIIVVSDASDDATKDRVKEYQQQRTDTGVKVVLADLELTRGKPSALNLGIKSSQAEIIVFADCRQSFSRDTIRQLVANFADTEVGCVSGELMFTKSRNSDITMEMGLYWRYEKLIRKLESRTGSVVGATGAVYAIRRSLFKEIPPQTLLDDVYCPLQCYLQGKRIVFDNKALAYDIVSTDVKEEWRRKVRTLAGNWQLFSLMKELKNPVVFRLWWKFYSHKIARLFIVFFLPLLFVGAGVIQGPIFSVLFWLQFIFYLLVGAAFFSKRIREQRFIGLCYFFAVLNAAAAVGFYYWLRGDLSKCWK